MISVNHCQPKNIDEVQEVVAVLQDQFAYHCPDDEQRAAFEVVRAVLVSASLAIIQSVPPCADRTTALRKLREARMDANSAIAHRGKY